MKKLKDMILSDARIVDGGVIKVDNFLNHQVDTGLMVEIGREYKRRFSDVKIDKVLTAEVSGIAIGAIVAQVLGVPMVFARKTESKNMSEDKYIAEVKSYTKDKTYEMMVSREYLGDGENIFIVDDFLANGNAIAGLVDIVDQSGANLVGVGIVIEKGFQDGGKNLRDRGIRLESLAIIDEVDEAGVRFRD